MLHASIGDRMLRSGEIAVRYWLLMVIIFRIETPGLTRDDFHVIRALYIVIRLGTGLSIRKR